MGGKPTDVWQGTLALLVLKTLDTMGAMHGYGIGRRIEQTSGDRLTLNYGTLYPTLLKLEQPKALAAGLTLSQAAERYLAAKTRKRSVTNDRRILEHFKQRAETELR